MSDHVLIDRETFKTDLKTKSHESWHHNGCGLHPDEVFSLLDEHTVSNEPPECREAVRQRGITFISGLKDRLRNKMIDADKS